MQPLLNKRLPSFLGFFFLLLAIGTITWLSRNAILFGTLAADDNTPKDVRVSNITDSSFTVSYVTDANVAGTLAVGTANQTNQVTLDDRDKKQNTPQEYTTHYITVTNLTPSTPYTFTITSGGETFQNGETPYQVTTGPPLTIESAANTIITGKVTHDNGTPATNVIVYVSAANSQVLSALTNNTGTYNLDLKTMRAANLTSLMALSAQSSLTVHIMDATKKSEASVLRGQANPIPLIVLSKNYDFAVSNEPLVPSPTATDSAELSGTPSVTPFSFPTTEQGEAGTAPQILTPQEKQQFIDQQPLFRGKALPNESVTITINSEHTVTATITADANGNWQFRPDEPLEPGTHTITIRTIDASGLMRSITQSFVVYAEGSQFTEPSVSPSANPTNTPIPTATATPRATNTPTPTKTTATGTPGANPTATATPTKAAAATISATTPPIPVTGNTSTILTIAGIISAVAIGALLLVFAAL